MAEREVKEKSTRRPRIMIVDDEASMRDLLSLLLEAEGYETVLATNGREATELFEREGDRVDLVIQDLKMPEMNGMDLLAWLRKKAEDLPVIVITAFSTWDNAVDAMRLGAYDYIRKPFDTDLIRSVVARAIEKRTFIRTCSKALKEELGGWSEMIGTNALMQEVMELVKRIAPTDSTVLVRGESGTGKELVARAIHYRSHRRDKPFVAVNCSAFTESLLESELFGHVRGAFTGAVQDKEGFFQAADGGTLFLDEVADMTLTTQVKILRVLEERKINPVGSTELKPIDVRIITATNKSIEDEIVAKRFREDLFYRLNVIPIVLPPLRARKDDVPLLTGHFLAKYSDRLGKSITRISDRALRTLNAYDWPGNVRELENIIQRHVALCQGDEITTISLGSTLHAENRELPVGSEPVDGRLIPEDGVEMETLLINLEKKYLREAIRISEGNLTNAAKLLGMSYRSMRYRVKKLQVREQPRVGTQEHQGT